MMFLILVLIAGFIFYVYQTEYKQNNTEEIEGVPPLAQKTKEQIRKEQEVAFVKKNFIYNSKFFTQSEAIFYKLMQDQNNGRFIILSKVRLEDIVNVNSTLSRSDYMARRNNIKSKHIDFLILDSQTQQKLCAIELDGSSHNSKQQKRYDNMKNVILNNIPIRFYRVHVGANFSQNIYSIFEKIKPITSNNLN